MKFKKPGLRIVKTFFAVSLACLISYLRAGESLPFYSAIAAIICLKEGVEETKQIGINRIFGTILGGICGLIYLLIIPKNALPYALELILISFLAAFNIWLMSMLNKPKAITIMAIVFLSITINHGKETTLPFIFAFSRMLDTMIGVLSAILINRLDFKKINKYNLKCQKNKND